MEEIKNNTQVYTTQEGMEEIKKKPLGMHYPRGYGRDKNNPQVYNTQWGIEEIKHNPQEYITQEGIEEIKK